jgi:transaldolase
MKNIKDLNIKIFADGADKKTMLEMNQTKFIQGLTTNPTLMKKAGIKNYKNFAIDILKHITNKPISFEVFSDDFDEMEKQALEIASWGDNVYVKLPITNTKGIDSFSLINRLSNQKVKVNVTALMTLNQVEGVVRNINADTPSYISIFAGRIADTGVDPIPIMREAIKIMSSKPSSELIWASPRELLNIFQANAIGCHVITATSDILKKLSLVNYDLNQYSLDTVKMFYQDALFAGYKL